MAETEESAPQWFSRYQEATDLRFSRLEAMAAEWLCRSRKGKKENSEDQALNDEELVETEVATELNGIEDRAVENEANTKMISAKVKEESIPQSKVSIPQSNSEILKSIEPGKVDLGLEKLEHVVMNEVDGDVERGQEAMSNTKICSAHQLFDQTPGRSSRANRVWKPGGLWYVQDHSGGSILMITQQFHGLQLQRIIYMDMKFQEVLIDDVLSVMVCWRMDETSSDLLLLNGKENEGCLNGSQALVLMKGITESSSRIEELLKEEPDFVKVNEVKMEKQKLRHVGVGMNKKQLRLSLRNNSVWDPGGSLVDAATPCLLSLHFTTLRFIAAILSFLKTLRSRFLQRREICYRKMDMGLDWFMGLAKRRWAASQVIHED